MIGIAMLLITPISKLEKCQVGSQLKRKLYQNEQTFSINTESFSNGQRLAYEFVTTHSVQEKSLLELVKAI